MPPQHNTKAPRYVCNECSRRFFNSSGLTKHQNTFHRTDARPRGVTGSHRVETHPLINGKSIITSLILSHIIAAQPCDEEGNFLPKSTPPAHTETRAPGDWTPFNSQDEFELADLLFTQTEMSHSQADRLMQIWATHTARDGGTTPFANSKELHDTIDAIKEGDAPWHSFRVGYNGERPQERAPSWMDDSYQVFYRNPRQVIHTLLNNRKFDGNFDYVLYSPHPPVAHPR